MLQKLREQVCEANQALVRHGLVIMTWGNVSGIDRASGLVVIKPSGVPYEGLTPDKMVIVSLDGDRREGNLNPSSDLPTHLELYRAFPGAGGITHTHSACATGFAQARRALPCYGTTHADHFYGEVPCTRLLTPDEVASNYELNTGRLIVETLRDRDALAVPAVLVAGHGPFTWGATAGASVNNSVALEACARMALETLALDPSAAPLPAHILDRHYHRKHGPAATYGQH